MKKTVKWGVDIFLVTFGQNQSFTYDESNYAIKPRMGHATLCQ